MASGQCPHCGGTEIDQDPARGDAVCIQCGSVLEDSIIVSEVQFVQDSSGTSRAVGQLVTSDRDIASGLNLGHGSYGMRKESRELTLRNARKRIQTLAAHLKLKDHCVDTALNFYKMALIQKLTKGRKNSLVVAACVYMVCRDEKTAHMLLDFSDILRVSVYTLGKTYLKLCTALCIKNPAIDPSLYIYRFAHQLQFGNMTHAVSVTATRLVHRMKKDWMHTGRRPSGLCGAALLVAARLHNFNRTVEDIIKVVKVCQATVRKRLLEFGDTPSSRLTLDEFMNIDLEEQQDPPSFKAGRNKKIVSEEEAKKATKQIGELQQLIEKALEKARQKSEKRSRYWQFTPQDDSTIAEQLIAENTMETINDVVQAEKDSDSAPPTENDLSHLLSSQFLSQADSSDTLTNTDVPSTSDNTQDLDHSENTAGDSNADCELDLTGLDDEELDKYIMNENETKVKAEFWLEINAEYLKEQKEKEERRLREEEENAKKPEKKRRKRQKRVPIQASTAGEAVGKMLQQRKISLKLNYDVLGTLNSGSTIPSESSETNNNVAETEETESKSLKRIRSKTKTKPKPVPAPVPLSIKQGISALMESNRKRMSVSNADEDDDIESESIPSKIPRIVEDENSDTKIIDGPSTPVSKEPKSPVELDAAEDDYDDYEDDEDEATNDPSSLTSYFQQYGGDEAEYSDYYDD